jgi:protein involved in temperature-dependent protein secretion
MPADLLLAIFVLEKVVKDSPANGHARILLLRLYRLIGEYA